MKRYGMRLVGLIVFIMFILLSFFYFDLQLILEQGKKLFSHPWWLLLMTCSYLLAFILRAWAWRIYLSKNIPFATFLQALFYSLFINHILPVKAGDAVRIGLLMKEKEVNWDESVHSVLVMRIFDLLILGAIAAVGALIVGLTLSYTIFFILAMLLIGSLLLYISANRTKEYFLSKHILLLRSAVKGVQGIKLVLIVLSSWILEAFVIYGVLKASQFDLSFLKSIWVNSFTIAGQIFHFTPGGIGNYESFMGFSLTRVGLSWSEAYSFALVSHLFKFIFAYLVGLYVLIAHPIRLEEFKGWMKKKRGGIEQ